ncbi:MAG TPA: hypothetical protein VF587_03775 [Solirubrobacteraceae bacterium]|jgi:hypothetical protein
MPVQLGRAMRAALLVAITAALIVPSAVLAKPGKDKGKGNDKKDNTPAVCERDAKGPQSPGLEKNGKTPPGQAKKTPDTKPCDKAKDDEGGEQQPTADGAPAPTPAPAEGSASSQSPTVVVLPPCTSKRYFKITLGRTKNVRRARVLLNGKRVAVTRGKRKVTARIDLRHRVKRTYVVRTVVVFKNLRIKTGTRRYRVCGG